MEKEKQIEEMIKITDSHNCPKGQCFKFGYSCNRCKIETLINAGYGNIKEAVKEFAEKLKSFIIGNCCVVNDDVDKIYKKINELETEVEE